MAILNGTAGDDDIHGTPDADTISGLGGNDSLFGEGGNDKIVGGAGHDFLVGNNGADNLIGGQGEDTLIGGRGNDTLNGRDTPGEVSDGSGFDVVNYFREMGTLGVTVNLATGFATDTYGNTDKLIDIEAVFGTNFADHLIGGDIGNDGFEDFRGLGGNDIIDGGSGFDRATYSSDFGAGGTQGVNVNLATGTAIDGFGDTDTLISIEAVRSTAFNDTLTGDGGNNRFEPLSGTDVMDGGGGTDRVSYQNDHIFVGNGNGVVGIDADLAKGEIVDTSGVHVDTVVSIENVTGSILDDVIRGDGQANQLDGRDGDDLLVGRGGDDRLNGGAGNDVLNGSPGNDQLFGDTGNDLLRGGSGDDELSGGTGNDLLLGGDGTDLLHGDTGDDVLRGDAGDDELHGFMGNDFLFGGDGIDNLQGWEGNDILRGGGGDEWLQGGPGDDLLVGDAGLDGYGFYLGDGHDRVNFIDGEDGLHFSGYGYASADDVVAVAVQQGNHVVIAHGGDSVTLLNFDLANLDAGDIILF